MKATQKQYEQAVKQYDKGGSSAVLKYAEEIGVDSHSYCRECESHTPDCHDDCCLVCGTHKPSARLPQLTLLDDSTILHRPLESEADRYRDFPPFAGGDDWHKVSSMLDLNVWEDGDEIKAAIYLVSDGKTLTSRGAFIPVEVSDYRTKPEPETSTINNIMFDVAASIVTDKSFDELTIQELVSAVRERLDRIEKDNEIEAFGFCDEYEVGTLTKN